MGNSFYSTIQIGWIDSSSFSEICCYFVLRFSFGKFILGEISHIFVVLVFTLLDASMMLFVSSLHLMLYFLIGSSLEGTLFTLCTMYLE